MKKISVGTTINKIMIEHQQQIFIIIKHRFFLF